MSWRFCRLIFLLIFLPAITFAATPLVTEGYVQVAGDHLHYIRQGQGPVILFVHGWPLDAKSWQCQIAYFSQHYTVLAVDLPGYGLSSKIKSLNTDLTTEYVHDISDMLIQLKIPKVIYVGFATGGHVGMKLAAEHPKQVTKLVLIDTSPKFSQGKDWLYGFTSYTAQQQEQRIAQNSLAYMADSILQNSLQDNCQAALAATKKAFTQMIITAGKTTLLSFWENIASSDVRLSLSKITAPTLIITGTLDEEVPAPVSIYMATHIANAQLVQINAKGHFVFATAARMVNQIIDNFIQPSCELCNY